MGKRLDQLNKYTSLEKPKQSQESRKPHLLLQVVTTIFSRNHPGSPLSLPTVPQLLVPGRALWEVTCSYFPTSDGKIRPRQAHSDRPIRKPPRTHRGLRNKYKVTFFCAQKLPAATYLLTPNGNSTLWYIHTWHSVANLASHLSYLTPAQI